MPGWRPPSCRPRLASPAIRTWKKRERERERERERACVCKCVCVCVCVYLDVGVVQSTDCTSVFFVVDRKRVITLRRRFRVRRGGKFEKRYGTDKDKKKKGSNHLSTHHNAVNHMKEPALEPRHRYSEIHQDQLLDFQTSTT